MFGRKSIVAGSIAVALAAVLGLTVFACGSAGTGATETTSTPANTGTSPADTGRAVTTTAGEGLEPAPAFSGVTLDGKTVELDQYRGKPLLLAYMTSG